MIVGSVIGVLWIGTVNVPINKDSSTASLWAVSYP